MALEICPDWAVASPLGYFIYFDRYHFQFCHTDFTNIKNFTNLLHGLKKHLAY